MLDVELAAPEPLDPPSEAGAGGADADGADADGAEVEGDELPPYPPPQPAAAIATVTSTAPAAIINRDLRMGRFGLPVWRSIPWWVDMWSPFSRRLGR
jgi:hypothetical protein